MHHVAIDLGSKKSQICVRDKDEKIIDETQWPTVKLSKYLEMLPHSRVVLETSSEAFSVADAALAHGHQVRVVPATLSRTLGVGKRGIKTDARDAQVLSEVSCRIDLPSVHIPSAQSRQIKSLCALREGLVRSRTLLINTVRGWSRTQILRVRSGWTKSFSRRVCASAQKAGLSLPSSVQRQLDIIDQLCVSITEADEELSQLAKSIEVCQRMMSVPGIGPVTSLCFVAAIDDVSRFLSAEKVQSYIGITPGEDSSSQRKRRTGITKAGAPRLRWALIQASWVFRRSRPNDPAVRWSAEIEKRRGRPISVVALARKLAGILYAIWRDGTVYQAHRAAQMV